MVDGTGNLQIPTMYGRSETSGCGCRFCDGFTTPQWAQPNFTVSTTSSDIDMPDVGLCMSLVEPAPDLGPSSCFLDSDQFSSDMDLDEAKQQVTDCLTPDRSDETTWPTKTMFLIGDSHSQSLRPALALAVRGKYQVRFFAIGGCGVLPTTTCSELASATNDVLGDVSNLYEHLLSTLMDAVEADDVIAVMQLADTWRLYEPLGISRFIEATPIELLMSDIIERVAQPHKAQVIVFGDWTPNTEFKEWFHNALAQEALEISFQKNPEVFAFVHMISLYSLFCDDVLPGLENDGLVGPTCTHFIPGTTVEAFEGDGGLEEVVTAVHGHFNPVAAAYAWPRVCDMLSEAGLMD